MNDYLCTGCMQHLTSEGVCPFCGFSSDSYEVLPHHLLPNTMLKDRYIVGKVLGEGGFGITYVGRDLTLDMKVAVKEFYMSGYVNRNNTVSTFVSVSKGTSGELFEHNREKFLSEARVLAKFSNEDGLVTALTTLESETFGVETDKESMEWSGLHNIQVSREMDRKVLE